MTYRMTKALRPSLVLGAPLFSVLLVALALSASQADGPGRAHSDLPVVDPGHAQAKTWNTQRVIYNVALSGIAQGGGLKIQFPKSWHVSQTVGPTLEPTENYYVSAAVSRPGAQLDLSVSHTSLDGRSDNLDWTVALTVTGASLTPGDVITYTFGDTSGGGRGVRTGAKAQTEQVRIALDSDGGGTYVELDDSPWVETLAGPAAFLTAVAPSFVGQGSPFELAVVAQDELYNAARSYTGTVSFSATEPSAVLPAPYTFMPADGGIKTFTITLNTPGTHRIMVTDPVLMPQGTESNPVDCQEETPSSQIYWGDIHLHTDFSSDARGRPLEAFEYARDVARLDFFATSDHTWDYKDGYTPGEWDTMKQLVAQHYQPGTFVTILGYEWTVSEPYGHRTVYFREAEEDIRLATDYPTLDALWEDLGQGQGTNVQALTVPHHTGKRWPTGETATVDWSYENAQHQRTVEIYSSHGQSEYYDPNHPLSYERVNPSGASSVSGPHYLRDGWVTGQKLGVIAASDNHTARPGQPHTGLTAVYAENLTREAIFDAIAARHTYATSGQRLVLSFEIDGHIMGEIFTATLPYSPTVSGRVVGTADLAYVEIVKYDGITYTVPYSVTEPGSRDVSFTYVDPGFDSDSLYYVRLQQVNEVEGRAVMAWSSPVWVLVPKPERCYLPLVHRGDRSD
jgi:hypothetical protein